MGNIILRHRPRRSVTPTSEASRMRPERVTKHPDRRRRAQPCRVTPYSRVPARDALEVSVTERDVVPLLVGMWRRFSGWGALGESRKGVLKNGTAVIPPHSIALKRFQSASPLKGGSIYFEASDLALRIGEEARIFKGEDAVQVLRDQRVPYRIRVFYSTSRDIEKSGPTTMSSLTGDEAVTRS